MSIILAQTIIRIWTKSIFIFFRSSLVIINLFEHIFIYYIF